MDITFSDKYEPLFQLLEAWNVVKDPDFTEIYSKEEQEYWIKLSKVDTVLISGGRDCFTGKQLVVTINGSVPISQLKVGDLILTYNEVTKTQEYKPIAFTKSVVKSKMIRFNLKNGKIIECSLDHEFYHKGGWVKAKDLLSLWYGNLEENT